MPALHFIPAPSSISDLQNCGLRAGLSFCFSSCSPPPPWVLGQSPHPRGDSGTLQVGEGKWYLSGWGCEGRVWSGWDTRYPSP